MNILSNKKSRRRFWLPLSLLVTMLAISALQCKKGPVEPAWKTPDVSLRRITFNDDFKPPDSIAHHTDCYFPIGLPGTKYVFYIRVLNSEFPLGGIWRTDTTQDRVGYKNRITDTCVFAGEFNYLTSAHDRQAIIAIDGSRLRLAAHLVLIDGVTYAPTYLDTSDVVAYSAVFMTGDTSIIFYGHGKSGVSKPEGFYHLSIATGKDSLVAVVGAQRVGFDVSPDGRFLIYGYKTGYRILDLRTHSIDSSSTRYGEWFRFSPSGQKVLFCTNATNSAFLSFVGVIDWRTGAVESLDVNTTGSPYEDRATLHPTWSVYGYCILFSQTDLSWDGGYPGLLDVWMKRTFPQ